MFRGWRLALLVILALPAATATGTLNAGFVVVILDNGHEQDCIEDATGLCLASKRGEAAGEIDVNADQHFRLIGVVVEGREINDRLPVALLPDQAVVLNANDLHRRQPVFRILTENVGNQSAPPPFQDFGIILSREHPGVHYYGVEVFHPTGDVGRHAIRPNYSKEGGYVGYEHVGPPNVLGNWSTDEMIRLVPDGACWLPRSGECQTIVDGLMARQQALTPNARIGGELHVVGAGSDRSTFGAAGRGANTTTPASLPPREPPPSSLTRPRLPILDADPMLLLASAPAGEPRPEGDPSPPQPPRVRLPPAPPAPSDPPTASPALAAAIATALVLAIAITALYSRIRRGDARLVAGPRQRVLDALRDREPPTVAELTRLMGQDRVTVVYHLRVLARAGLVVMRRVGREVRVTLPGRHLPAHAPSAAERILAIVVANVEGNTTRESLREDLPMIPERTRNHAVRTLIARGLLLEDDRGRLHAPPAGKPPASGCRTAGA